MGVDAHEALASVPGVTRVALTETTGVATAYEVASEAGRDVRRELAATIVMLGWGLLELRPMRMSLEEIFLSLTTDETSPNAAPSEETPHE
jgi:ABC-2 type transport system ATP-binding protein